MRLVKQAENHPNVCLVTRDAEGPWIDFEVSIQDIDPHVYLSEAVVAQAAEMLGYVSQNEVLKAKARCKALEEELAKIQKAMKAAEALEEALA